MPCAGLCVSFSYSLTLSLTHPVTVMVICEECLLQVTHPFRLVYMGSFSFTHAVLVYVESFSYSLSLTHHVLVYLCGQCLLVSHTLCWFMWGVSLSLIHPVLVYVKSVS